jgi:hypothetical protein
LSARVLTQFEDFDEMSQEDLDYLLEKFSAASVQAVNTIQMGA